MENDIDSKRQDLLSIIDEWRRKLDDEYEEDSERNEVRPTRDVLTVKELSVFLGVSTDSIYAMVREGQIPHFRVRSRILFYRTSIKAWCGRDADK